MTIAILAGASLATGEAGHQVPKPGQDKEEEDSPLRCGGMCLLLDQDGGWTSGNKGKVGGKKQGSWESASVR